MGNMAERLANVARGLPASGAYTPPPSSAGSHGRPVGPIEPPRFLKPAAVRPVKPVTFGKRAA